MENKLFLKQKPTLKDFQEYLGKALRVRGFERETAAELVLLFLEEAGEMAKAVRKTTGVKTGTHSKKQHLDEELADVFIYLLEICNHFHIDLETAFRKKEEKNKTRTWK
ncbi:MAG: hypothetical protein A3J06_02900 [Candidatus Moranbacteria bacterium RIFCSPLOWO2_02_FULL_48_19]|nr:MAG: hypothetical protein A3J06_02900 [Candidatus Moranbacteria bacterium RIFCSPLOWO2_02_FULL_48_19]OGI29890.1 MAG: hypothetical protein A3G09_04795 [Candidatus Moranbacteria bacterium RIFCSPLOWO2_12_FULL_48_12]